MIKPSEHKVPFAPDRRDFIKGVGSLTLVIGSSGLISACSREQAAQMQTVTEATAIEPNIWVTIASDDTVTIQYPATEMGQGTSTTLPMILADELDADWDNVVVETLAVHDQRYGNPFFQNNLYTAGSLTVQAYFQPLRRAGAQARRLLMQAAADEWGVPLAELETEPSAVVHPASGERLSYGELVGLIDMPATVPEVDDADLKPFGTHRYLGTDMPRRDMPAKSNGTAEFGIDVQVPGMVYASVLRAPVEGESPMDIDETSFRCHGVSLWLPIPSKRASGAKRRSRLRGPRVLNSGVRSSMPISRTPLLWSRIFRRAVRPGAPRATLRQPWRARPRSLR